VNTHSMQLLIKYYFFQFSVMFINEDYQTSSSLNIHSGTVKQNSKTWTCSDYIYFKHWGSHSALDYLVIIWSVVFEGLNMTR